MALIDLVKSILVTIATMRRKERIGDTGDTRYHQSLRSMFGHYLSILTQIIKKRSSGHCIVSLQMIRRVRKCEL
jgi:hypothetical protein